MNCLMVSRAVHDNCLFTYWNVCLCRARWYDPNRCKAGSQIPLQAENYLETDTSEGNNFVLGSLEDQKTLKNYYYCIYFKSMRLFRAQISPAKK